MWWHYAIGFVFSVVAGHLLVEPFSDALWKGVGWKRKRHDETYRHLRHGAMLGVVERAIYTASWLLRRPEFIGFWISIKTVGGWEGWSKGMDVEGRKVPGRSVFNMFLLGNALSIGYAVVGALLVDWLSKGRVSLAVTVPLVMVGTSLVLWAWAVKITRQTIQETVD